MLRSHPRKRRRKRRSRGGGGRGEAGKGRRWQPWPNLDSRGRWGEAPALWVDELWGEGVGVGISTSAGRSRGPWARPAGGEAR